MAHIQEAIFFYGNAASGRLFSIGRSLSALYISLFVSDGASMSSGCRKLVLWLSKASVRVASSSAFSTRLVTCQVGILPYILCEVFDLQEEHKLKIAELVQCVQARHRKRKCNANLQRSLVVLFLQPCITNLNSTTNKGIDGTKTSQRKSPAPPKLHFVPCTRSRESSNCKIVPCTGPCTK